jgi:hypothetical protein
MPNDDRQWVIDAAKAVPGVLNAYHLLDEATAPPSMTHTTTAEG